MRIGVTGHQHLPTSEAWSWVRGELDRILPAVSSPLVGVSSLAIGADQVFAEAILAHGGSLEAVVPFPEYEERFRAKADRNAYRALLQQASRREVLPRAGSDEESYYAAGCFVVDVSDLLIAIWDGEPARGRGGTADIVRYAERVGKHILHLNPMNRQVYGPSSGAQGSSPASA
jgi:hypothetical protein